MALKFEGPIRVKEDEVYDGDTIRSVLVNLGLGVWIYIHIKFLDIQAPELRTKDEEEKARAIEVRDYVRSLIADKDNITVKLWRKDQYGRWLGDVYAGDLHINKHLIETGRAITYEEAQRVKVDKDS